MEETIGYEALFSPEEWPSMQFANVPNDNWAGPDEDPLGPPTPGGHR